MIVNTPFIDELEAINIFKQGIMDKNNQNKIKPANRTVIEYVRNYWCSIRKQKTGGAEQGPYTITKVWTNGAVTIRWGGVKQKIRIRWIKPYHE